MLVLVEHDEIVKKNCSNFENSNQLERKLASSFFIQLLYSYPGPWFSLFRLERETLGPGYFIQSILNKIEMPRTHLPNL